MPGTPQQSPEEIAWRGLSAERKKALLEMADQYIVGKSFWRWMRGLGAIILGITGFLAFITAINGGGPLFHWSSK